MKHIFYLVIFIVLSGSTLVYAGPGDTTVVRTFRYDTNMRQGMFNFPDDPGKTYEKILMLYSMRCKNGLVSNSQNTNQGCGEWDYNCFTYVIDSSQTDSLRLRHNSYDINGFNGTVFQYTHHPVYSYTQYTQQSVQYQSVLTIHGGSIDNDSLPLAHPLSTAEKSIHHIYLYTASEMTALGMAGSNISSIKLFIKSLGSMAQNLRIRLKMTNSQTPDSEHPETDGFTEVYFLNTLPTNTGLIEFRFFQPFYYDGVSSLLVDFSFDNPGNGTSTVVKGHDAGFPASMSTQVADGYTNFSGGVQMIKLNPAFFNSITDKITIAFWAYGDSLHLPTNTTLLEGADLSNRRQVNIHMPWGNSRIYWDCGNDGSDYDRIDNAAATDEIKGKWNFWTFTKNAATGNMSIYKNGHLWASGGGKTRPIDIRKWYVGKDMGGSLNYWGNLDELSIWNKDLDSTSIRLMMQHDITASHPDYSNLMAYYQFNQQSGDTAVDSGPLHNNSYFINPGWRSFKGRELFRNFSVSNERPNTVFISGTYLSTIDTIMVLDSTLLTPTSIISYAVNNNNLSVIDTIYVWPAGYTYISDPLSNILDSLAIAAQDSVSVSILTYYQRRPMRVELINFITPYGIGLNLNGLTGKTWIFDVTDYANVLKGRKFMAMSDGIYQEDNDITFVYYEGTPPRDVVKLQQIWPSGSWVSPSYNDIYNDNYFEARMMKPVTGASQYKVRSAISGHGQEGEFIPRWHTLTLNDSINFTYKVWKHCADNPIYPQGGTWVYERAGWCPGAVVDTREFEITGLFEPGQEFTLDYSLPYSMNPGSSNYRVNNQLVAYGNANYTTDAAVDYIKQPSDRVEFARFNPLCNQPVVCIKNTGSDSLTSVQIVYGRTGTNLTTFNWTGSLGFLQSEVVTLPMPDWFSGSSDQFIAYVHNPNGMPDQYAWNDTVYSRILVAPAYTGTLVFEVKTNNRPWENEYILLNSNGDTVLYRNNLSAGTLYRDTLSLADDCYLFKMKDTGDDGLSFWAEPGQGSGYTRIKSSVANIIYKTFGSDFGDNIYHQFRVDHTVGIDESGEDPIENISIYPNPAADQVKVSFDCKPGATSEVSIVSLTGQVLQQYTLISSAPRQEAIMDISPVREGMYLVVIRTGSMTYSKQLVIIR